MRPVSVVMFHELAEALLQFGAGAGRFHFVDFFFPLQADGGHRSTIPC